MHTDYSMNNYSEDEPHLYIGSVMNLFKAILTFIVYIFLIPSIPNNNAQEI